MIVSDTPNCGVTYDCHYDDHNSFIIQATDCSRHISLQKTLQQELVLVILLLQELVIVIVLLQELVLQTTKPKQGRQADIADRPGRGARKLIKDNLKLVWAKFSTLS